MLTATCMQRGESRAAVMMVQGAAAGPVSPAAAAAPSPLLATASAVAQAHWRRRPQNKSRTASPCLRQPACNGTRAEQSLWWCRGLLSAQFSPAAAAAPSPLLAIASAVAQAHWRRRPQNKSRAASSCLRQPACDRARAQQSLWWFKGLLSAQFSPAAAAAPSPPLATASAVAQAHWRRRQQNKSRAASPCLRQPACNRARAQQSLWWCKGLLSARRRCRTEPASSHSERRSSSPLAPPPAKQVPGGFSMLTATFMQRGQS